ncbi:SDR family NAD(P)-dependent oxidoreductase [Kocuria sp. SL71]|uniref:SDR family NAD(P)-dependent oxidoreductase n=1 Tax=Kocuria sp. SL71 TaxID=2995151 RepID=UPI002275AC0F|nr:SDR family NAD(P)-dependent oxidoreductase [Kocuria sp. SL71]MCY1683628.1 SDR family NAD(P)-dependent oxidoreductase [Kocuria sp. SL71]
MTRILVTGSTTGVGRATAAALLEDGHDVVVHARSQDRLAAVEYLIDAGAASVVGDLADPGQVRGIAEQAQQIGPLDAVIHNAGVIAGADLLSVNVVAPYVLTTLLTAPRLIYLSSSMHRGGRPELASADWSGASETVSYSDTKLLVTALMAAVARLRPDVLANAVDPGWVPTRMGGPDAAEELELAHVTQAWLATSQDAEALSSGGYWHHGRVEKTHANVHDEAFQDELLAALAEHTGTDLRDG